MLFDVPGRAPVPPGCRREHGIEPGALQSVVPSPVKPGVQPRKRHHGHSLLTPRSAPSRNAPARRQARAAGIRCACFARRMRRSAHHAANSPARCGSSKRAGTASRPSSPGEDPQCPPRRTGRTSEAPSAPSRRRRRSGRERRRAAATARLIADRREFPDCRVRVTVRFQRGIGALEIVRQKDVAI